MFSATYMYLCVFQLCVFSSYYRPFIRRKATPGGLPSLRAGELPLKKISLSHGAFYTLNHTVLTQKELKNIRSELFIKNITQRLLYIYLSFTYWLLCVYHTLTVLFPSINLYSMHFTYPKIRSIIIMSRSAS